MLPIDAHWNQWTAIPYFEGDQAPYGWGVYENAICDLCAHRWTVVAPVGSHGKECPQCGHVDPEHEWGHL
jgi:hypothetical protein